MSRGIAISLLCCALIAGCSSSPSEPAVTTPAEASPAPSQQVVEPSASAAPLSDLSLPTSYKALGKRGWQKVVKAPDNYLGNGYKVWACITQFDAATGDDTFRGDASYHKLKYWFNGDNSIFTGDASQLADYVQGDIVAMSVVSAGSFSYDTQVGGNTTVPAFLVVKIKRLKGSC